MAESFNKDRGYAYVQDTVTVLTKSYQVQAQFARWQFFAVRFIMLLSAALVTIYLNFNGTFSRFVAVASSVLVLLMIALDWGTNARSRWFSYQQLADQLDSEKNLYLNRAGVYSGAPPQRSFALLVERTEAIRTSEVGAAAAGGNLQAGGPEKQTPAASSPSAMSQALANYEGEIRVLPSMMADASTIVCRLDCRFYADGSETAGGESDNITTRASVRIQGGQETDPVEFSVKVMSVSGERLTAFPRVAQVYAPTNGISEPFEFALAREDTAGGDAGPAIFTEGVLLVDVSQAGRTIQILEMKVPPRTGQAPRLFSGD